MPKASRSVERAPWQLAGLATFSLLVAELAAASLHLLLSPLFDMSLSLPNRDQQFSGCHP